MPGVCCHVSTSRSWDAAVGSRVWRRNVQFCCQLHPWSIPVLRCGVCRVGEASQQAGSKHPHWEAARRGGSSSLPMLSPDVISPLQGGSEAKGQALLALTALGSLAGVLFIWAVPGDRVYPGPHKLRGGQGVSEPALLGCCQGTWGGKRAQMNRGALGSQPLSPA